MVIYFQQQDGECILGHTEPRNYIIACLTLISLVFVVMYILYIHILVRKVYICILVRKVYIDIHVRKVNIY